MLQRKNKKIFIYIFLFLIIATFNNKNLDISNFFKIASISIKGLDEKNKFELSKNLNFLKNDNIFLLDKSEIKSVIETNNLVEKYSVFIIYPSSIKIVIKKTNLLAYVNKGSEIFLLGSNGKLIKSNKLEKNLPSIFGDFKTKNFFELKDAMLESNFNFSDIKNLYFFKSGRWDIETKQGLLIKLPHKDLKKAFEIFINFSATKDLKEIKKIDLRQNNQIVINE